MAKPTITHDHVYATLFPWLKSMASRLVRPGMDAEDLAQEAFEQLVKTFNPESLPPEGAVRTYLARVLLNRCREQWRKIAVRERAAEDPVLLMAEAPEAEIDGYRLVTDEDLRRAIESLSPKLRQVYELQVEGKDHAEIARQSGISMNAVRKRLFDARQRLRDHLSRVLRSADGTSGE